MNVASKERLRAAMRERRLALSREEQEDAEASIVRRLEARPEFSACNSVALYWAVRGEVPTQTLYRRLRSEGRAVFLSRLRGENLEFAEAAEPSALVPGPMDLLEPTAERPAVPLERIDLVLVPGLAFDLRGARLGWGKGYYDRVLRGYGGLRWGLAYDFQVFEEIPAEARDESVHWVFTETRSIDCRRREDFGREP